jgi:hypothetical protein
MYLVTAKGSATYQLNTVAEAVKKAMELQREGKGDVTILASDGQAYTSENFSALLAGGTDANAPNA